MIARPSSVPDFYRGWIIHLCPGHPVTGQVRAYRHGVRLGGTAWPMVKSMLDQRAAQ